ncbi:MAG: hypothetical protein ACSLFP_19000 [Acidimicrobiales bacterium]
MTLPAPVRLGAAGAAVVLASLSQGDLLVLAAVLVLVAWRPLPALGVVLGLAACAGRWSSSALVDVAGAQAVLGPAGIVEPVTLAASAWLGALAVVAASPRAPSPPGPTPVVLRPPPVGQRRVLRAEPEPSSARAGARAMVERLLASAALGLAAAVVVAGPAPGGALWARALAALTAAALAFVVGRWRARAGWERALDVTAAVAGAAALLLVVAEGGPWSGTFVDDAALEGAAIGAASILAVAVAVVGAGAMERRRI